MTHDADCRAASAVPAGMWTCSCSPTAQAQDAPVRRYTPNKIANEIMAEDAWHDSQWVRASDYDAERSRSEALRVQLDDLLSALLGTESNRSLADYLRAAQEADADARDVGRLAGDLAVMQVQLDEANALLAARNRLNAQLCNELDEAKALLRTASPPFGTTTDAKQSWEERRKRLLAYGSNRP